MQSSPTDIKNRLLKALDKEYNVVDMAAVIEIITILERTPISKEALESTRLGKFVNELRRKTSSEPLARRAKDLVRRWRNMIARPPPDPAPPPTNGRHAPSAPLVSPRLTGPHLMGGAVTSPALSRSVLSPPVSVHSDASSANRRAKPNTVDVESVPRTHAANKRLRKDSPDGRAAKVARLNGVSAADVFGECSRESFNVSERSESVVEIFPAGEPAPAPKRRGRKKGSTKEALAARRDDDIVKSSIASIARTPKVKTTRELMAGLNRAPGAVEVPSPPDSYATRAAAAALEMSRNKTEHIAKFLRSQSEFDAIAVDDDEVTEVRVVDVDFVSVSRPASEATPPEAPPPEFLSVAEILAKLPPLPAEVDLSDGPELFEPAARGEVTPAAVGTERLPGVNGNYDDGARRDADDDGFREWHETVSKESYRGELLHILPYVVID